jgi:hypothetical protein
MSLFDWLFGRGAAPSKQDAALSREPAPAAAPRPAGGETGAPTKCAGNPGRTRGGRITFENGAPPVAFDLVQLTAEVLRAGGHEVVAHETWLELRPSGFVLLPLLVDLQLRENGVSSLTTMDVRHATLIPDGLFEYQHSTGDTVVDSLRKGIEDWSRIDLPVLLDALRPKPQTCSMWEMTFPAQDGAPARLRRAVLGSVSYYAAKPPVPAPTAAASGEACETEHSFCTCCLLTRNFEAFRAQLEGNETLGIRLYAMRGQDGQPGADCRINGEDYEPGIASLRAYVATWPQAGFEFRKQYVLLYTPGAAPRPH